MCRRSTCTYSVGNTRLPTHVAFDLIWFNGADLRRLSLTERRRRLQHILPKGSTIISEALSVTGTGHKLFELMCANDIEGIVTKRLTGSYNPRVRRLNTKTPTTRGTKAGPNCSTNRLGGLPGTFASPGIKTDPGVAPWKGDRLWPNARRSVPARRRGAYAP